jgi:hypothetical protein
MDGKGTNKEAGGESKNHEQLIILSQRSIKGERTTKPERINSTERIRKQE